jgi:hypothetical protein
MLQTNRTMFLCAGLQSSGSTLISWCFLQRGDMDGMLDARTDLIAELPCSLKSPFAWLKTTISSFRLAEQKAHFEDLGWTVRPLLICRDVREVYASLRTKRYGSNGTTAEDPPLRLRFRRFREDWELFQHSGWPILGFEHFLRAPEEALRLSCVRLDLAWDNAMLSWPKPKSSIMDARNGNETFLRNRGEGLLTSIKPNSRPLENLNIPAGELAWLEEEFSHFNRIHCYPAHITPVAGVDGDRDIPRFSNTRRFRRRQRKTWLAKLILWLKDPQ